MKAIVLSVVILFAHAAFSPSRPTTPTTRPDTTLVVHYAAHPRFVVLDDYVRDTLAVEWRKHLHDDPITERIYCVRYQRDYWAGEPAYRVTRLLPGDSTWGTPTHSYTVCPKGFGNAVIHSHPPTTCDPFGCYPEGPYSYQCLPSDDDKAFRAWRGDEFGLVICDEHAVVTYWP